jgi:hypothetical protein
MSTLVSFKHHPLYPLQYESHIKLDGHQSYSEAQERNPKLPFGIDSGRSVGATSLHQHQQRSHYNHNHRHSRSTILQFIVHLAGLNIFYNQDGVHMCHWRITPVLIRFI